MELGSDDGVRLIIKYGFELDLDDGIKDGIKMVSDDSFELGIEDCMELVFNEANKWLRLQHQARLG
eukprot:12626403-Ditylum_brightwellii.AAC.1